MELEVSQLPNYIDDIAKRQMPFATASALTQTASAIGKHMANLTASSMNTLTPFSRTHRTARIGGAPSPASSYATIPANKRDGMDKMFAELGNQHWGISEQIDQSSTDRTPNKTKYLWVPLQGRVRGFSPGKALNQKRTFLVHTKRSNQVFIGRNKGRGTARRTSWLFVARRRQTITPRINFHSVAKRYAYRLMNIYIARELEKAIATAKP